MDEKYSPSSSSSSDIIDASLMTSSVNYHGPELLKLLISQSASLAQNLHNINLKKVDYKNFEYHVTEIRNAGSRSQDIIEFIAAKSEYLFGQNGFGSKGKKKENILVKNYEDYYEHLIPIEYLMNSSMKTRKQAFEQFIEEGDLLYACVPVEKISIADGFYALRLIAFADGKHRFLQGLNQLVKVLLRDKDTVVPTADQDTFKRWMSGTRLRVEVLSVIYSSGRQTTVNVGTKGVTLTERNKHIALGKVRLTDFPASLQDPINPNIKNVTECIEKMNEFKNPQCIKSMAIDLNIDLHDYSSLMSTVRGKFSESENAKSLRKAQMCKWAHKSVADGVEYFKKGLHEEAFQCLNKALQIDPDNVEALVAKGALLANLGKYAKAVEEFEKSLKINSGHVNARKYLCETLVELAKQYEEKDNLKEAEKSYVRCLELNEDHEVAMEALKQVCKKLGCNDSLLKFEKKEVIVIKDESPSNSVIADLIEIELNKKKEEMTPTIKDVKDDPAESKDTVNKITSLVTDSERLSPLSQKMAMHDWQMTEPTFPGAPPLPMPNMFSVPPPAFNYYSNPQPLWTNHAMQPVQAVHEVPKVKDDYDSKVDEFLKHLQTKPPKRKSRSRSRSNERKKMRNSGLSKSKSRSHKKNKDYHEPIRSREKSIKAKSRSRGFSRSKSPESSKKKKKSRRRSSSSSTDYSDDSPKKRKKKKSKKSKSANNRKSEEKSTNDNLTLLSIPDFKDLEEKLQAYYEKMEALNSPIPSKSKKKKSSKKESPKKKGKESKKSEETKIEANGSSSLRNKLKTHPAFVNSNSESEYDSSPKKKKRSSSRHKRSMSFSSSSSSDSSSSRSSSRSRSGRYKSQANSSHEKSYSKSSRSYNKHSKSPSPAFGYYHNKPCFDTKNLPIKTPQPLPKTNTHSLPKGVSPPRPMGGSRSLPKKGPLLLPRNVSRDQPRSSLDSKNAKRLPISFAVSKTQIHNYLNDKKNSEVGEVRFGKWASDKKVNDTKSSLDQLEKFVETAKQSKLEKMKERNKEFLKPPIE